MPRSVAQAAELLGVNHERVRALIAAGALEASKLGGRWLIEDASLERLLRRERPTGRPFSPRRSWGLLMLAAGRNPGWLSGSDISRLRGRLRDQPLRELLPRLYRRARVHHLRAHPSDLVRLADERDAVRTASSAAQDHGLDLVAGDELDIYLPDRRLKRLRREYALTSSDRPNLTVRVIPKIWPFEPKELVAPEPVVAVDLATSDDPRTRRAGLELLDRIDR